MAAQYGLSFFHTHACMDESVRKCHVYPLVLVIMSHVLYSNKKEQEKIEIERCITFAIFSIHKHFLYCNFYVLWKTCSLTIETLLLAVFGGRAWPQCLKAKNTASLEAYPFPFFLL